MVVFTRVVPVWGWRPAPHSLSRCWVSAIPCLWLCLKVVAAMFFPSIWMLSLVGWIYKLKWEETWWLDQWHMAMTMKNSIQDPEYICTSNLSPLLLPPSSYWSTDSQVCVEPALTHTFFSSREGAWTPRSGLDKGGSLHLLWRHLGDQLEGGEASGEEAVPILDHFDGTQPVIHGGKGREVWDRAVKQGLGRPGETERSRWPHGRCDPVKDVYSLDKSAGNSFFFLLSERHGMKQLSHNCPSLNRLQVDTQGTEPAILMLAIFTSLQFHTQFPCRPQEFISSIFARHYPL